MSTVAKLLGCQHPLDHQVQCIHNWPGQPPVTLQLCRRCGAHRVLGGPIEPPWQLPTIVSEAASAALTAASEVEKPEAERLPAIVYIQRDIEAMKHTLDRVLRPYKSDVKALREENTSLRVNIHCVQEEQERILRFVAGRWPETVDEVLALLLDPGRRGWRKFRAAWLHRLGLVEEEARP